MHLPPLLTGFGFVCLLTVAPQASLATTASDLLLQCQQDSVAETNYCAGYIAGAIDGGSTAGQAACIPDDISSGTLAELAVNALRNSAATATDNASSLINARLAQVFPCNGDAEISQPPKQNWSNKERLGK